MPQKPAPDMQDRGRAAYFGCAAVFLAMLFASLLITGTIGAQTATVKAISNDSALLIARMPQCTTACPDSILRVWYHREVTYRRVVAPKTTDTVRVPRGNVAQLARLTTTPYKSTVKSGTVPARVVTPPPVTPPALPDSMAIAWYRLSGAPLSVGAVALVEHDTVLAVARYNKPWPTRRAGDTTIWGFGAGTASLTLLPRRGSPFSADTALVIVASCACRESGNAVNPPRFDMRRGEFVVYDGRGRLRPVTPLASDPFRLSSRGSGLRR